MNLKKHQTRFAAENCKLDTVLLITPLNKYSCKTGYITESDVETLKKWRVDPAGVGSLKTIHP